jgi:peptidase C25-like protein
LRPEPEPRLFAFLREEEFMRIKGSTVHWLSVAAAIVLLLSGMFSASDLFTNALAPRVQADSAPQPLPFNQTWSNTGLITTDDNWSGVPGITGFRGDDLTTVTATDPQTILADGSGTPVDVIANQANPNTQATGGVAEFDGIANPVVALQGSGTADAPHIVITVNTTGLSGIKVAYVLRDIDGSTDNAVQPVALQYRVGSTGNYTNLPAGFVADATTGPSLATLVTPVSVTLPADADNQPVVQIRIITTNAIGNDEWVGVDDILVFVPSSASVDAFTASARENGKALLEWRTGLEVDNLGFNLYREAGGRRVRINSEMLAGSALMVGAGTQLRSGRSYRWVDDSPNSANARYWLEAVSLNGRSDWHGPVSIDRSSSRDKLPAAARSMSLGSIGRNVAQSNPSAQVSRAITPTQMAAAQIANQQATNQQVAAQQVAAQQVMAQQVANQSEIASRPAIKLSVNQEGWYKVTAQELFAAGLDPATDPRLLQLFAEGGEQAIAVKGESDGRLDSSDSIEFYGLGLNALSTDVRVYWLVRGTEPGQRIKAAKKKGSRAPSTGFPYSVERKDRAVYFSALRNGERENFFGAVIARNPVDQTLFAPRVDRASTEDATLEVGLQGVTAAQHRILVQLNGTEIGAVVFASDQQGAAKFDLPLSALKDGQNIVTLSANSGEGDVSLVDYIRLSYRRAYFADDNQLRFTASSKQRVTIDGFTESAIRVLDVTDPNSPLETPVRVEQRASGYAAVISVPKGGERILLAFSDRQAKRPAAIVANQPSSLKGNSQAADYLIIERSDFFSGIEPLKLQRQSQGLDVSVVDIEDIYDEFNYGEKSAQAIKDFLAYAKSNWSKAPRFVLLVGDASFDPKNYLGAGDWDLIPTKLVDTILMETASDGWLADFDGDGLEEMAIGRLPARSADEVSLMVQKIIAFDAAAKTGDVLLVSDSNDGIDFENGSAQLRSLIPNGVGVEEIVRGRLNDDATKSEVLDRVSRGKRIVNYYGHGSVDLWRGGLLTSADARELGGASDTLFFAITCLNGYFQDVSLDSIAESLVKAEHGGAAAVWASSGQCAADGQLLMNLELFRLIFRNDLNATPLTFGEAALMAKSATADGDARQTYILFGDPAMRLR